MSMNKNMKDVVKRTEDIGAKCDALMENPPSGMDNKMAARESLKEAIDELEALQSAFPDNRYPCVGTNRKLPRRSILRAMLERKFKAEAN